jgi:hypothetical protein
MKYMAYPLLYAPKVGAYTELWAGLSPDLKIEDNGLLRSSLGPRARYASRRSS